MRKKQTKDLKRAILNSYLKDNEIENLYKEASREKGDTKKILKNKIWSKGSKRYFLYKNGKKIFKNTSSNKKELISIGG